MKADHSGILRAATQHRSSASGTFLHSSDGIPCWFIPIVEGTAPTTRSRSAMQGRPEKLGFALPLVGQQSVELQETQLLMPDLTLHVCILLNMDDSSRSTTGIPDLVL